MKDQNCLFCKIAAGEIPSSTIFENEDFRVIMDLGGASIGHALILPKEHYENLHELDDEVAAKVLPLAKKIINGMKAGLGCDGVNIVQNNGAEAGQSVMHFHLHMVPRYKGANEVPLWIPKEHTPEEMNETAAKIASAL